MPAPATTTTEIATTPLSQLLGEFLPEMAEAYGTEQTEKQSTPESETEESDERPEDTEEEAAAGTEESESEAAEEEETETDEQEEEAEETEPASRKEWPESARRRVDKLTAKLREAEQTSQSTKAELDAMREQLQEAIRKAESAAETSRPAPTAQGPEEMLADTWSESDLLDRTQQAINWLSWAAENPEGGEIAANGKTREFSSEDVARIKSNAERLLHVGIPKRREFLQQAIRYENGLRQEFPEAFKEDGETWKGILGAFKEIPQLKARPDGTGLAMMLSLGLQRMQELRKSKTGTTKQAGKPAAPAVKKPAPAPKPIEAPAKPAARNSNAPQKAKAVEQIVAQGGSLDALESYFLT